MDKVYNNNSLENIKSFHIWKIIFYNLKPKRLLNIIKYSKRIQNILDIGINDYKTYKKIEIELEMIPNVKYTENSIINIPKGYESFFHIYFNDEKNEIKKYNFTEEDEFIKKINIIIDEEIASFEYLFELCCCIKK